MRKLSRWLLYGLVVWGVVSSITAPNPRVIFGADQIVLTNHPELCVHTRLIDEVEEWVIQRTLIMVREMGATTIVEYFPWAYIEHSQGNYDWQQADRIIQHAHNQGLQVIARLGMVPAWAQSGSEAITPTLNYLPVASFQDFANFAATFAERYAQDIQHIIIWNEPNLAFEWGYQQVSPETYVDLLTVVYETVKHVNPDITILGGALAPTLEAEESPNGMNDLRYLQRMFAANADEVMDGLAVHTYGFTREPEEIPATDQLNFRRPEMLFEIMRTYGADNMPVYITEMGWNDHPRWAMAVTPAQRIDYTIRALQYAKDHWQQVDNLCLWVFRYPLPTLGYPDHFTLVTTDFQKKPIYYALQEYAGSSGGERSLWLPPPTR